jgi:L,D-transpeptidase YcbB
MLFSCDRDREFSDKFKERVKADTGIQGEFEGDLIYNLESIAALYEEEEDRIVLPKWGSMEKVDEMLFVIRNISREGLHPQDYHLSAIESLVEKVFTAEVPDVEDKVKLELLLTDAYLMISTHLSAGKTDQETVDPRWKAAKRTPRHDLARFIDSTIVHDQVIESLASLTPRHREYANLKKALAEYRTLAAGDGWEGFQMSVAKLEQGMDHPDVVLLRKRLNLSTPDSQAESKFDQELHLKVVHFQQMKGLAPDGVVGRGTAEALNISIEERIATIEANMERWRWMSDDLGERYIKVNIPNFEMQVIENDLPVFTCEAIVGRAYRQTPVFSAKMDHLVFAPTWTLPPTILWNDVIPAMRRNSGYLSQNNMQVLRRDGSVVNPSTIDWATVNRSNFPYMIRQEPGRNNALGNVKFMFPNQYHVYIHDTPARNLFERADRSFSSGCIRISKPMEFAAYLLQDKPEWTPAQMNQAIAQRKERTVFLSEPIPVHILYMTVWAEDDGTVHFRRDIYDRDGPLVGALKQGPGL